MKTLPIMPIVVQHIMSETRKQSITVFSTFERNLLVQSVSQHGNRNRSSIWGIRRTVQPSNQANWNPQRQTSP